MNDQHSDVGGELLRIGAKTLPGGAGTVGAAMTGEQMLSLVVGALTILFLLLQIGHLLWKWRRDLKAGEVQT